MNIVLSEATKEAFNKAVVTINNWANGTAADLLNQVNQIDTTRMMAKVRELQEATYTLLRQVYITNALIINWGKAANVAVIPNKVVIQYTNNNNLYNISSRPLKIGTKVKDTEDEKERLRSMNAMLFTIYENLNHYLQGLRNDIASLAYVVPRIEAALDQAIDIVKSMIVVEGYIQDAFKSRLNKNDKFIADYTDLVDENIDIRLDEIPLFEALDEEKGGSYGWWCKATGNKPGEMPSGKYPFSFSNFAVPTTYVTFYFKGQGSFDITEFKKYTKPEELPPGYKYAEDKQYVYIPTYFGYLAGSGNSLDTYTRVPSVTGTFTGKSGAYLQSDEDDLTEDDFVAYYRGRPSIDLRMSTINVQIEVDTEVRSYDEAWQSTIGQTLAAAYGWR